MKYKTIYADPPWMEHGGGKIQRGADRHYPLMKTKDIMTLHVQELIDPEKMHRMIEKVSYGPRIELFAREKHKGWDVWGNEVEGVPFTGNSNAEVEEWH